MPTTFSLRFLSISALAMALLLLFSTLSIVDEQTLAFQKIYLIRAFAGVPGFLILAFFLEFVARHKRQIASTLAVLLIVFQGILILINLYDMGSNLFERFNQVDLNFFIQLVFSLSNLLLPLGLLLLGISYLNTRTFTAYNNRVFLILQTVHSITGRLFYFLPYFLSKYMGFGYSLDHSLIDNLYLIIDPAFDIALLYFVFHPIKSPAPSPETELKSDLLDAETVIESAPVETTEVQVLTWFGKYLWLCIPIVNLIFLVFWSGKSQTRIFRNWAIAQYWITCLGILVSAFYIYDSSSDNPAANLLALVFPVAIIIGGIVLTSRNDQGHNGLIQTAGIGTWLGRIFLAGIPLIGLIYLIVTAADTSDQNQQKWAKAQLLLIPVNCLIVVHYLNLSDRISSLLSYTQFEF